jgi:hypothetical protein
MPSVYIMIVRYKQKATSLIFIYVFNLVVYVVKHTDLILEEKEKEET